MELRISNVPATVASLIALRPALNAFNVSNLPQADIKFVDEMSTKLIGRPYPKLRKQSAIVTKSDGICFFTNFAEGIPQSGLALSVVSENAPHTSASSLFAVTQTPVDNQLYITITPVGNTTHYKGFYLVASNPQTGAVLYLSRVFYHLPDNSPSSVVIEFKSDRSVLHNYPYPFALPNQTNRYGVMASINNVEYPDEREVYMEVTTGRRRLVTSTLERDIELETYYQDFFAHEALAFAFFHEQISINGRPYLSKDAYTPNLEKDNDLSSGVVMLSDILFTQKTKSC